MIRRAAAALALLIVLLALAGCGGAHEAGWGPPERVPVAVADVPFAAATVDAGGGVHVAWPERHEGRWSLLAIDRPPDGAWSAPRTISTRRPFRIVPLGLAANERGDVAAV